MLQRHNAAEYGLRLAVGHDRPEEHSLESKPPRVGRQVAAVEPATTAAAGVDAPANLRPLDASLPDLNVFVFEAEVVKHERMRGDREHAIDRAAGADQLNHCREQFGPAAHLADTAVGHQQRQVQLGWLVA